MYKRFSNIAKEGKTFLANGQVVYKDDLRIELLGQIDELNCFLGMADNKILQKYQQDLIMISAYIAVVKETIDNKYWKERIKETENIIETIYQKLPEIKSFILPKNRLHITRSVCRRVERNLITLYRKEKLNENVLLYFDRLSDLLFVLAREKSIDKKSKI